MGFSAAFRCIAGCPGTHPLDEPLYRCPTCGDLLEVAHDLDALKTRSAAAWMRLFDDRYKRTTWPYGSAVWGKKEWVAPSVRDDMVVSMDEGGTNLFWADRFGRELGLSGPVGQAVRQLAHRQLQGSRHDRAGVDGAADDRRRQAGARRGLRLDGRHLGLARRLLRRRRHPPPSCCSRGARSPRRSWCSRSPTARSCSRSTPTSTAAWPSCSGSPPRAASTWRTR